MLCAGFALVVSFTSCKSSESAYKKAYEKAQAQAAAQQAQQVQQGQQMQQQPVQTIIETPVVTPVQTMPANGGQIVDNNDNVQIRQERVTMVNGAYLRNYSVVVGSFSVIANAEGLQQRLRNAGYNAQIVKNDDRNMYRVVASTFDTKSEAVASRDQLRASYPDAWLLFYSR